MKSLGLLFAILSFLITSSLFAQDMKNQKNPDEQIIVNKKFDENGNIIQYDSTYIHRWSSDSTFQFLFPENDFFAGNGFPDLNEFFNNFMSDSAFESFNFSPFEREDFFENFPRNLSDSIFTKGYPFMTDSAFHFFYSDSLLNFPKGSVFPNMEEFFQNLNPNSIPPGFKFQQFNNQEQMEEWRQLMEKHQIEMEQFKKKWKKENNEE